MTDKNRRSGADRRNLPNRRQKQELFNSGEKKHMERRRSERRKGPRRQTEEQEW